ncbi:restriction endonuclease [Flindersiella endophytica]
MDDEMTPTEYELLTQRLLRLISKRSPLTTSRLEHNVKLQGRSTSHQIDVLWEFQDVDGSPRRVLIECRHYRKALKQKDIFAFHGVVTDIATQELPATGVMVTLTGYQSGAKDVAHTYGVIILQLREPTLDDLKNRAMKIVVTPTMRVPFIGDVRVTTQEVAAEALRGQIRADRLGLLLDDGRSILLQDLLWDGILTGFEDPPAPLRPVTRKFLPPAVLTLNGQTIARISEVCATVGEVERDAAPIVAGGHGLAWMIANVLKGTRVWFTDALDIHVSNDRRDGAGLATDVLLGRPTPDAVR